MSESRGDYSDAANKFSEGQRLLRAGDYQTAVDAFSAAITVDPDHWTAYFRRSEAYRNLGMEEQARADLERAEFLNRLAQQDAAETGTWTSFDDLLGDISGGDIGAIFGGIVGAVVGFMSGLMCYYFVFMCSPVFGVVGAIFGSIFGGLLASKVRWFSDGCSAGCIGGCLGGAIGIIVVAGVVFTAFFVGVMHLPTVLVLTPSGMMLDHAYPS